MEDHHTERALFRPVADGISAYEVWQVQKRKLGLRQEYLDHWNSTVSLTGTGRPVDAIISPMAAYVAPPHGKNKCVLFPIWNNSADSATVQHNTRRYGMLSITRHSSSRLVLMSMSLWMLKNLLINFTIIWIKRITNYVSWGTSGDLFWIS